MRGKAFSAVLLILAACATPSFGSILIASATTYSELYVNIPSTYYDYQHVTNPSLTGSNTIAMNRDYGQSVTQTRCLTFPQSNQIGAWFHQDSIPDNSNDRNYRGGGLDVTFSASSNMAYSIFGSFGASTSPANALTLRAILLHHTGSAWETLSGPAHQNWALART